MRLATFFYSPLYEVNIGTHVFHTDKYRLIKEHLAEKFNLHADSFISPKEIEYKDLEIIHSPDYIQKVFTGTLLPSEEIQLELPYSKELAKASITACAGSLAASIIATKTVPGLHIGGGFHHAYPEHGEGFCVLNDVAYAAEYMRRNHQQILIIDADVHQGNGTAVFFKKKPEVFTFSIHQENNYPVFKERSDYDISLADATNGEEYNHLLFEGLNEVLCEFVPDHVIFIAGADPFIGDKLGGLSLSLSDMLQRDRIIKDIFYGKVPISVLLGGGYATDKKDLITIHSNTLALFGGYVE